MLLYLSIIDIFYFNKYQFKNVSLYGFIIMKQLKIFFCEQLLGKITLLKDKIYFFGYIIEIGLKVFFTQYVNPLTKKKKLREKSMNLLCLEVF